MSILDDVRSLAEFPPVATAVSGGKVCAVCGFPVPTHERGGCPVESLPKIIAVLETAEAVAHAYNLETAATGLALLGSPLLAAVDALDKALEG